MKIKVSDARELGLVAMVGAAINREDWQPKKEFQSEELKKSPDGRGIFSTRKAMLWMDEQGEAVQDVSITVIEPSEVKAAGQVTLAGTAWVTHWIKDGRRLGVSIVVERLEPVKAAAA